MGSVLENCLLVLTLIGEIFLICLLILIHRSVGRKNAALIPSETRLHYQALVGLRYPSSINLNKPSHSYKTLRALYETFAEKLFPVKNKKKLNNSNTIDC